MLQLILPALSTIGGIFSNWQKRKLVKAEGKVRVEEATVEANVKRAQSRIDADITYDQTAVEGMRTSWKDELWTIWFIIVLTACFVPEVQVYVKSGFVFLKEDCPEWFTWCVLGSVVASFGLKDWFKKLLGR